MRSVLFFLVLCSPVLGKQATEASDLVTRDEVNQIVQELRQDYEAKIAMLKATMESVCYNSLKQWREKKLVLDSSNGNVAFYAQLTRDLSGIGNFQPIVYDHAVTNLGNAYESSDGIFTAPVNGVYVFTWTNTNWDRTHMETEIVVKGVFKGHTISDSADHDDASAATGTAVLVLKAVDTVWIRSNDNHTSKIMGQNYSTFSGWLLYETEA